MKIMLGAILREETHTKIVDDSTNDDNNEIVARVMRHTYIVCVCACVYERVSGCICAPYSIICSCKHANPLEYFNIKFLYFR